MIFSRVFDCLAANLRKIGVDALKDWIGSTLANLLSQPFNRIASRFTVVAPYITTPCVVTQGDDIARGVTTPLHNGYPMVLSKRMPQPGGTPTNSTAMIKVFKAELPIIARKTLWQGALSSATYLLIDAGLFRVLLLPIPAALTALFDVFMPRFRRDSTILIGVVAPVLSRSFLQPVGIIPIISGRPLAHIFSVVFPILFIVLMALLLTPICCAVIVRLKASWANVPPPTVLHAKILVRLWKEAVTVTAKVVSGVWNIQHSASLSLYLRWVSADGEIDRRFGCTALADARIIPENGAGCYV